MEGCSQNTAQCAPHLQGLRSPPEKKIASAAVTTTRSNRTLSRLKTTTQINNSVRTRIRVALVIVVINSSLLSRDASIFVSHFAPASQGFDRSGAELQAHSLERERVRVRPSPHEK